jgi:Fe-S cluster biogenesis protein NfuA/nitrite reductase/ring-hydroxylating ferredoxin subunit
VLTSEQLIERVQVLTAQLEEVQDLQARAVADELVAAVIQLYGAGLERIMAAVDDELRGRLAEDGVVASLLLIHDLYPVDLETRVREALDSVRPYMESHGGDVELLAIEEGVAKLRLVGHCKGCPASEATLELAIKKALEETAPDLEGLEVEGVKEPPLGAFELPVIQEIGSHPPGAPPAWTDLDAAAPPAGTTAALTVGASDLLLANVGGTLLAYRNACGWCRARLDDAPIAPDGTLTCPSCERRFELRRAGRSPDDDRLQIPPVPLLRGEGRVRVAVG